MICNYCEGLMIGGADGTKGLPIICQFKGRQWKHQYIVEARKAVDQCNTCRFFWFFPDMDAVDLRGVHISWGFRVIARYLPFTFGVS